MKKTLICWNDDGDEIKIVDIDGTLCRESDGESEPLMIDCHQGSVERFPMNRENVKNIWYEVGEDSSRNFCSCTCMPSDCFKSDLESDFRDDVVTAIMDFFDAELKAADDEAREYLTPMEKEYIEEDFSRFLDEDYTSHYADADPNDNDAKVENYLKEVRDWRRGYSPDFHDDDEIREICRKCLKD